MLDTFCVAPADQAMEAAQLADDLGFQDVPPAAMPPTIPAGSRAWAARYLSGAYLVGLQPDGACMVLSLVVDFDLLNRAVQNSGSARLLDEPGPAKINAVRFQRGLSRPVRELRLTILRSLPAIIALVAPSLAE